MYNINDFTILDCKTAIDLSEINHLAASVGWGKEFYRTEEQWQTTLASSSHIAYIKKMGQLICFGRLVEDGQMCMFYDICVHPDYQKRYLGTNLMNHLIDKIKHKNYVSIGLFVWQGNSTAAEFYRKFGFEISPAMELKKYMKQV
ncbi:GNAT family N-acetyltransferase [Legionella dresdenensis]|uniref:GNAT family N-acetyltransferase n=1 Tax=Legionella dresdenensis TaxID=450200 RepID=A0ABV8CI64_9GAMM